jgi:hypothetical protein
MKHPQSLRVLLYLGLALAAGATRAGAVADAGGVASASVEHLRFSIAAPDGRSKHVASYSVDYSVIDSRLYLAMPGGYTPLFNQSEFIGDSKPAVAATNIDHASSSTAGSRDGASTFHLAARLADTAASGSWANSFSGSNFFSRGDITLAPHSTLTVSGDARGSLDTYGANVEGYATISVTLREGSWGPVLADYSKRLAFGRLPRHSDSFVDRILLSYANPSDGEMSLSLSISSGASASTVMAAAVPGG